ncbi:hypothetical protein BG74_00460 [Sodalis-like endosymbiont of Proechinophthirus fluctus]|nr:hypothetical protein BG74_00460 [Sodalis-like endosymbiont of Proechinophthirus fluctus]
MISGILVSPSFAFGKVLLLKDEIIINRKKITPDQKLSQKLNAFLLDAPKPPRRAVSNQSQSL